MSLDPYLTFDGQCGDAMKFYQQVLGGKLQMHTVGESPGGDQAPAEARARIMHARLDLGDRLLMASDDMSPQGAYEGMKNIQLSLNYRSADEAKRIFDALSVGGNVTMPFQKTFWAEGFGMCRDRYGTPWMVNVEGPPA
jgi:PhnB protein